MKRITGAYDVCVEEKIAFLAQPGSYHLPAEEVIVKETHMSWVFLVNGFVYKMKKPVAYDLFDHRSLHSRYSNCKEELRINKILAENIYEAIVPLTVNENGRLELGTHMGEIVEWLVKMKRVPEESMLDYAILHDCLVEKEVLQAAALLISFYREAPQVSVTASHYIHKLENDIRYNDKLLASSLFDLPTALLKELAAGMMAFLAARFFLFKERVKHKKIIDAHGDLRPEHICLKPEPAIIDRLEFSKELRKMDIAEELSFLLMECEMLGNKNAGWLFLEEYEKNTGDYIPRPLIRFYMIKKACVRAYLVARHIEEERYRHDAKWLFKANAYLKLAEIYLQQLTT